VGVSASTCSGFLTSFFQVSLEAESLLGSPRCLISLLRFRQVELLFEFDMDFYPSFPPIVTITRPRLMGSMLSRVSTLRYMNLCCPRSLSTSISSFVYRELHVDHWNSVGGMKRVLQAIHKVGDDPIPICTERTKMKLYNTIISVCVRWRIGGADVTVGHDRLDQSSLQSCQRHGHRLLSTGALPAKAQRNHRYPSSDRHSGGTGWRPRYIRGQRHRHSTW